MKFRGKPFAVVVIDPGEKKEAVQQFASRSGWRFDVLLDPDNSVSARYGVRGHPMNFLIKDGKILAVAIGYRDWASRTAVQLIEKILAGENR